jgi:hypothetical protein
VNGFFAELLQLMIDANRAQRTARQVRIISAPIWQTQSATLRNFHQTIGLRNYRLKSELCGEIKNRGKFGSQQGFASEFEIRISGGQMMFQAIPDCGVTDIKLGKHGKLQSSGTTKVSRAPGPIFLIFVVPRRRCVEEFGIVKQSQSAKENQRMPHRSCR